MYPPPSPPPDLQQKDQEHLNLLALFHFIAGGLALLGIGGLYVHYLVFSKLLADPEFRKPFEKFPLINDMPGIFIWFYVFAGVMIGVACVLNLLSGLFLRQRKHRIFSIIVAAMNCLQVPLGTLLGVFTIIVLSRDSVRQLYDETQNSQYYQ